MKVGVACSHKARGLSFSHQSAVFTAVLCFFLSLSSFSLGQAASSRKVDYGVAVQEFIKQGFPQIEGAQYVKVVDQNLQWNCDDFWFEDVTAMTKLTGNGFYIPNKDNSKPGRFIFLGGCELSYVAKGKKVPSNVDYQALTRGDMQKADLKKDIALILKWAATASTADDFEYYGTENFSVAFGFANLIYQMGYKKEANELFKTIFLNHQDPEQIIDYQINARAEREYGAVYNAFNQNADWKKYHTDLLRLQAKYPRGWEDQPGLEILIPQVKNRMDKVAVPSPKIEGHAFSPEIQKILDATVNPPKSQGYYDRESLFLINKVGKNAKAPPLIQLTQHGMDGFIALVALIGDTTLVIQNNGYSSYSSSSYSSYDDDRKSPENAYNSLNKPSTRGAVALSLVRSTMPQDYSTLGRMPPEQLKRFAIDWWKKHRNDSKMDLTKHYLQMGNQSHVQSLATALMNQDTEESRALLEKSILTSKKPSNLTEVVKSYVKKRRVKSKEFISKYKVVLTKEIGDGKEDGPYSIRKLGGTEKYIASLMRYTTGLKPAQMLTKLSRKDAKVSELMEMLTVAYQGKEVSKDLNKFIYAAAKKKKVSEQINILRGVLTLMYAEPVGVAGREGAAIGAVLKGIGEKNKAGALTRQQLLDVLGEAADGFEIEDPNAAKKKTIKAREISFSKYEKEDWEKLLFSKERSGRTRVSVLAGMLLDKFVNPDRTRDEYSESQSLGVDAMDTMIQERSKSLLEGKKLAPLPDPDLVAEDRKKKVLEQFKATKLNLMRKMMLSLDYSERLVVINDESYRDKMKEAATFIQGFAPQYPGYEVKGIEKLQAYLKPLLGLKGGAEAHDQCAKILLEHLNEFAGFTLNLNSYSQSAGSDIGIYNVAANAGEKHKKAIEDVMAGKLDGFVSITSYDVENNVQTELIYTKGKFPTKAELQKLESSSNIGLMALTKSSIEKQRKELASTVDERKKIIDELIKLSPSLEEHKARFEQLKLEQLKQYHKQYKQMMGE